MFTTFFINKSLFLISASFEVNVNMAEILLNKVFFTFLNMVHGLFSRERDYERENKEKTRETYPDKKLEPNCLLFNYNYILWAKKFNKWQENEDGEKSP